jgi:hypothetical protein
VRNSMRERQDIVDYVAVQTGSETVEVLEKVYSESLAGLKHKIPVA